MKVKTTNPATGLPLAMYEPHSGADIERLLTIAHTAAQAWGSRSVHERVPTLSRVADVLRDRVAEIAALVTAEMGKPLSEAASEVEKSALTAEFYATHAEEFLADSPVEVGDVDAWIAREPIGLVLAIAPWNFPIWQAMRFAIPALAAGNGVILKHAPNVTGTALLIQELCERAGIPPGVLTTLVVEAPHVPQVVEDLIADARIAGVTLTGSNRAGSAVGAAAGRAVKPSVLELGGSDAFVVLADADVPAAAAMAVTARFNNAGQSCVCAKRFIVESSVAEEFIDAFVAGVSSLVVGDPTSPATHIGPLARPDLRDNLIRQINESVTAGAQVLIGGAAVLGAGNFFTPTVLAGVEPGMAAFDEETFGPLAAVTIARDEDDAIRLANSTRFGLGLSVWSRDVARATSVAQRITSGLAFINAMVVSDARLPFGGIKASGYGRELSDVGMLQFVNTRTYWSPRQT